MKKLATVLTTIPMCLGLAVAQTATPTPQSTSQPASLGNNNTQTWVGILVDSKCSSTATPSGVSSSMPRSTASSVNQTTGMPEKNPGDQGSLMKRGTPAESGRTWNSTDNNTSGTADRSGTSSSSTIRRDAARTSDQARTSDLNRSTRASDSTDRTSNTNMARNTPGSSYNDQINPRGPDTQRGNNSATTGSGNWDRSCYISPASSSFVLQLQDGRTVKIDDAGNSRISSQLQSTGRVANVKKVFRVMVTGTMDGDTIHLTDIQM